ncbi:MAG: DUF2183 domain-containing protein [Eudoraea sp.]|nr:DUF2183 domain-containing protein [Eudoraea sp.]
MGLFRDNDELQIIAFQSYGTKNHLYAKGRALEDEKINLAQKGFFRLLLNTWKRFETDEVRNTKIQLKLPNGRIIITETDYDGYFLVDERLQDLILSANEEGWLTYELSFADTSIERRLSNNNRFPGEMLIPTEQADFGVISDIDDTILHTGVVSSLKWQVIKNTFFKRAESRVPLEGAVEFYHLLHRGGSGSNANPIFYVSHSPWNLYRYLEFFLTKNKFPKGPVLLRSMSSFTKRASSGNLPQKHKEILNILKTYPDMGFILIGDSGERDADIYMEISRTHPGRIKAIYIRGVKSSRKTARVKELIKNHKSTPALLVEKSAEAIEHARKLGFVM